MSFLPLADVEINNETHPFWDALRNNTLMLPRCTACQSVVWYPRAHCPICFSTQLQWEEMSGNGTVYSYSIVAKGNGRWKESGPYVVAYVELAEGPRILTNIVGVAPSDVHINMPVVAVFDTGDDGRVLLRFSSVSAS